MNYIQHKSSESVEDYLETILLLQNQMANVRSIDIANELNFTKPSVSNAMKNLKNLNYITIDTNGYITLTTQGRQLAEAVFEKHTLLSNWLRSLGVPEDIAVEDACRMEHDISEQSFSAIKKYINDKGK